MYNFFIKQVIPKFQIEKKKLKRVGCRSIRNLRVYLTVILRKFLVFF